MKYLEILMSGESERYMLHVPDDIKISNVINALMPVNTEALSRIAIYHFKSGRFLDEEETVARNGVESGDSLLIIRQGRL